PGTEEARLVAARAIAATGGAAGLDAAASRLMDGSRDDTDLLWYTRVAAAGDARRASRLAAHLERHDEGPGPGGAVVAGAMMYDGGRHRYAAHGRGRAGAAHGAAGRAARMHRESLRAIGRPVATDRRWRAFRSRHSGCVLE